MKRRLGVNIDHIASIREARKVAYPDPVTAMTILKECDVDQVTLHLREDRRHIQDHDLKRILRLALLPVNLEMAVSDEMVRIACQHPPTRVTLVPEKRQEVTTEGGLDCVKQTERVRAAVQQLKAAGIGVSLFIDPELAQVVAAKETGAEAIEIHTGTYCNVIEEFFGRQGHYDYTGHPEFVRRVQRELEKIQEATKMASEGGLAVYAGHGLHKDNLAPMVANALIEEYNIGHAIIARAVFVGLVEAIGEIQRVLRSV